MRVVSVLIFTTLPIFATFFFTCLCCGGALYDWVIRAILIIAAVAARFFRRDCPSITQGNQSFLTFLALIWQGPTRDTYLSVSIKHHLSTHVSYRSTCLVSRAVQLDFEFVSVDSNEDV